ncbi:serine acetyltransferase [Betaproteobacteria bacterium]|nr:serine acetyltransferase [Betaproteobacteria bacterium]GHT99000.1 serine acetyltransferase [Betaproteobacteria bacterium]GHU02195.1 serine acetyltransferase [Betaproteobacteria bacterium]GHU23806.1 serine acetyltransferase [Betaproteobacteria bacterium]GHU23834.1 serine acetyltransferase [Betaproteobacteria bacterium]
MTGNISVFSTREEEEDSPPASGLQPAVPGLRLDIDSLVAGLRDVRVHALQTRSRIGRPPKLPSRKALAGIVEGLAAALFPNRLGAPDLTDDGVDFFVGHTLDRALRGLYDQIRRELRFAANLSPESTETDARAGEIVQAFAVTLTKVRQFLDSDILAAFQGDPAARSVDEVLVCYPGIFAITYHRIAHELYRLGVGLVARIIAEIAHSATGIDIHPGASIGSSFFIDHGTGVVIGETAVIGERVKIYQAVTLGAKRFPLDENGHIIKGGSRHPIVEDDVVIYAGATILGRVTIGRGSSIGGSVWLTKSVPPGSNITQALTRSDEFDAGGGI